MTTDRRAQPPDLEEPQRDTEAHAGVRSATDALLAAVAGVDAQLTQSVRELEDIRYALDQSAIVATTDVSGRIKYVNDKFCQISKYSREDLLGQDHRILNSAHHPKDYIRELWRTIAQGHVWRGELRNRAKDGTLYWVDTTIVPFLDARRHPWQYMAIRYDITERKRQEALLREQTALARLGEMAAVVAHEVRNPLAGIRGALQVIASRLPETMTEVGVLKEVVARVDGLNDIVEDLLVFARQRELKLSRVQVRSLLVSVASLLKQDEAMSGVQVEVDGDDVQIEADAEQLRVVLSNLLLNAAQAMERRGRIVISARSVDARDCVIAIADEGPGIPEDVRDRIFDPFFTTKTRGTGLGLPTAKRIIDMHAGSIDIECPPSGGTIVRVTLPIRQQPHGTSHTTAPITESSPTAG
jgi:PAS domain S-box-containing protein